MVLNISIQGFWVLPIILLLCAACSTKQSLDPALVPTAEYLEQNPLPTPESLFQLRPSSSFSLTSYGSICLKINQQPFWIPSDSDIEIQPVIVSFRTTVDGSISPTAYALLPFSYIEHITDEHDQEIGWYPSDFEYCFEVGGLDVGLHIASIDMIGLTGKTTSYTWAFRIEESQIQATFIPPTLFGLPMLTPTTAP
jgi:hypothetical protein